MFEGIARIESPRLLQSLSGERFREMNAVLAVGFGFIEGLVRPFDQFVMPDQVKFLHARDPHADAVARGVFRDALLELLGELRDNPLADLPGLLRRRLRQQDSKLIAAETCPEVGATHL